MKITKNGFKNFNEWSLRRIKEKRKKIKSDSLTSYYISGNNGYYITIYDLTGSLNNMKQNLLGEEND